MTEITIEMVDQVLERLPYATYKEAKEALLKTDGDVLEAIIYIEEGDAKSFGKAKFDEFEEKIGKDAEKIKSQLMELLKKATVVRIKVEKEGRNIINIPLTVGVVGAAIMPVFALLGLSAAVLSKYSVKIVDDTSGDEVDLGSMTPEKLEILKEMFLNSFQDIKSTFYSDNDNENNKKEDSSDITDELLKEEEDEDKK
ncbi:DUF4342 domain-containing protein [Peptostreptococcus canis]|uniref:DUF4342 domain-containing protein n=1 Tax=Peptostreptococcus canis TaxID=1159213 RepID=A0ABR6TMG0_9FIRM|nr:DUF4342 domain-containing protein [Peptostreptococcus canis]MBC2576505.1 DUF4342 domain-containing protein [Peptostreptococcus canis]MBP1998659.1 NACalpha-BTF3-like transcription factor [Peptostreptococcus canis]